MTETAAGKVGTGRREAGEGVRDEGLCGCAQEHGRRVIVAMAGEAADCDYRLCAEHEAETTATVALAILADYLGETARAAALQAKFEKLMRGRLEGSFWALTETELDQVLSGSGSDQ